jgi:hypothetical protein
LLVDPTVPMRLGDLERFHHVGDAVEAPRRDGGCDGKCGITRP